MTATFFLKGKYCICYIICKVFSHKPKNVTHSLQKILLEGNCFKLIYVVDIERQPSQIGQCGRW